jgi:hypothetical protein
MMSAATSCRSPVKDKPTAPSGVAGGSGTGWIGPARHRIGIGDAHLALQAIRVTEEEAQDWSEVRDELVGGAAGHEPSTNRLEGVERLRLECQVIETSPPGLASRSQDEGVPNDRRLRAQAAVRGDVSPDLFHPTLSMDTARTLD